MQADAAEAEGSETGEGTASEAPEVDEEPAPESREDGGAEADCLVGDWIIAESAMQEYYDSMDTPAAFTITGDTGLTFENDTYEYTPDFTLEIDLGSQTGSGTLTGSISGTYLTEGGVITTSSENNDIQMTVTVGGTTMDSTDLGTSFLEISPINSAEYECTPTGPVITWQNTGDGLDIRLVPRG